jgi:hypothetical protein
VKPGGGRQKGAMFERHIAKRIVDAFTEFGVTKVDCYRTPSSGGHRYAKEADPGDLVISERLRGVFPFHVECKHHRDVDLWTLLVSPPKKSWKFFHWLRQAIEATTSDNLHPMVVFKANSMPILCAIPATINTIPLIGSFSFIHVHTPVEVPPYRGWRVFTLDLFLQLWVSSQRQKQKEYEREWRDR